MQDVFFLARLIVSASLGGKAEFVVARRTRYPRTWQRAKISENDAEKGADTAESEKNFSDVGALRAIAARQP